MNTAPMSSLSSSTTHRVRAKVRLAGLGAAALLATGSLAACGQGAQSSPPSADQPSQQSSGQAADPSSAPTSSGHSSNASGDLKKVLLDQQSAPNGMTVKEAPQLPPGTGEAAKDVLKTMTISPKECAPLKSTLEQNLAGGTDLSTARFVSVGNEQVVLQVRPGADYDKAAAPSDCRNYTLTFEVAGQKIESKGTLTPVDMQLDGVEKSAGWEITTETNGVPGGMGGAQQSRGVLALTHGVTVVAQGQSAEQAKAVAQAQIDKINKAG